jgi:hypothetical protein
MQRPNEDLPVASDADQRLLDRSAGVGAGAGGGSAVRPTGALAGLTHYLRAGRRKVLVQGLAGATLLLAVVAAVLMPALSRPPALQPAPTASTADRATPGPHARAADLTLLHTIKQQTNVAKPVWSQDARLLAAGRIEMVDNGAAGADGPRLVEQSIITIWDAASGQVVRELKVPPAPGKGPGMFISSLAWSPDGRTLAAGFSRNVVVLLDAMTGQSLQTFSGLPQRPTPQPGENVSTPMGYIDPLAWSPDGHSLAAISDYWSIRVWGLPGGEERFTTRRPDIDAYLAPAALAWSPDGRILAEVSHGVVRLWEGQTGRLLGSIPKLLPEAPSPVPTAPPGVAPPAGSPTAADDPGNILAALDGGPFDPAWAPDGGLLATRGARTVALWDPATGLPVRTMRVDPEVTLRAVAWTADGRLLAGLVWGNVTADTRVYLWDPASGARLRVIAIGDTEEDRAFHLSAAPTGTALAVTVANRMLIFGSPGTPPFPTGPAP